MQEIGNNILYSSVIDETLSADFREVYITYAQVYPTQVILALLDTSRNKFIALEQFSSDSSDALNDSALLINEIVSDRNSKILEVGSHKSCIGFYSDDLIHIPSTMFDDQQSENIHQLQSKHSGRKILFHKFLTQDIRTLYTVNPSVFQTVSRLFPNAQSFSYNALFAEGILLRYKHDQMVRVNANICLGYFDLVISQGSKLILSNQYSYKSSEDFMYYSMTALEQLELNPDSIPFHVAGEVARNSGLFIMARKYIRNFEFMNRPDHCTYSYAFDNFPLHQHAGIFTMPLCVS